MVSQDISGHIDRLFADKKIAILILILFLSLPLFSQTQRLILLEHFTQASSTECATVNPDLQEMLNFNEDKMISIKYHVSWPGQDTMNAYNPYQVASRVNYYGVSAIPYTHIDGNYWNNSTENLDMLIINNRLVVPSPFEIALNHTLSPGNDSVFVVMKVKATQSISGSNLAHIAIVGNQVHFNSAPGSNGETDFYNVMKRLLPNELGTQLPASMNLGDSVIISESWPISGVYDTMQIAVIGFVQDNATKFVHQAAYSPPIPPLYNDVAMLEVISPPSIVCESFISPVVIFRNMGNVLTTTDITYNVNGGADSVYHWSGNLRFLGYERVLLDTINYNIISSNELEVYSSNPNGGNDTVPSNDTTTKIFYPAFTATNIVSFELKTDNYPEETSWKLFDSYDSVLYSGGPYTGQGNTIFYDTFSLPLPDCYNFVIYDEFGDGICCSWGNGYYKLKDETGFIFASGGFFGFEEMTPFKVDVTTPTSSVELDASLNIFPNPARSLVSVSMFLTTESVVEACLYDMYGGLVCHFEQKSLATGNHMYSINVTSYSAGLYYLCIIINNNVITRKITIVH